MFGRKNKEQEQTGSKYGKIVTIDGVNCYEIKIGKKIEYRDDHGIIHIPGDQLNNYNQHNQESTTQQPLTVRREKAKSSPLINADSVYNSWRRAKQMTQEQVDAINDAQRNGVRIPTGTNKLTEAGVDKMAQHIAERLSKPITPGYQETVRRGRTKKVISTTTVMPYIHPPMTPDEVDPNDLQPEVNYRWWQFGKKKAVREATSLEASNRQQDNQE
jgi:hypothetical protein